MADTASRPRLILWDIDHTLIETRGAGSRFARAAFEEITGKRIDHMADATGKTEPLILAETLKAQGIEPSDDYQQRYAQALPEQYRRNAERLRQVGRVLPGAVEALSALRQVPGVIQTVLTGNYQAVAATKLATFALDKLLDLDVGAYADDATDRAALVPIAQRRAADRYGHTFTRENTVIVGDTTHDVAAAHVGGAAITAVATGNDGVEELRAAGADVILTDLADTAAVLRAVTRPEPPIATARLSAGALFTDDAGRVLLVRPTYKDYWDIPGGYVEPGESPLAACRREIREELSIAPPIAGQPLLIDWAPADGEGDKILFIFSGRLTPDELSQVTFADGELAELRFVEPADLEQFTIARLARRIRTGLAAYRAGHTAYAEHGNETRDGGGWDGDSV